MDEAMTEAAARCKHSGARDLKKMDPSLFITRSSRPNERTEVALEKFCGYRGRQLNVRTSWPSMG
jgi:hypothetical protein